jgi:polyphosphate kinase
MDNSYKYFKRDVSWLSFNYRVLVEAEDQSLPLFERVKFLSIYSSNLEEFYKIRVADHRSVIMKKKYTEESITEAAESLNAINEEVKRQQTAYHRIYLNVIKDLATNQIKLYQNTDIYPFHQEFVRNYFNEEVFPFLQPVMISKGDIKTFIRDNRLYLVIRMCKRGHENQTAATSTPYQYAMMKIPHAKVPRFVTLPSHHNIHYLMFIDDIIKVNLSDIFPGYDVESCYSIKISRDADIYIEDESSTNLPDTIRKKIKRRKIGALSRFMYDVAMPSDFLSFLCQSFNIESNELVEGGRYLNLQDLMQLPNPIGKSITSASVEPIRLPHLDATKSMFAAIKKQDILLQYPYQSFDYLIRFLNESALDPKVEQIKITQYRVAEDSAVINALIFAAKNGKKVTVFVELKARFDEENNLLTAERMREAGISIIYSIPKFKVHAKVVLISKYHTHTTRSKCRYSFAYLSTGNFNEKTARIYADMALFTSHPEIVSDVINVFRKLEGEPQAMDFKHLLVAPFNMVSTLLSLISYEIDQAQAGKPAYIILKMNGLHDQQMIDALYKASQAGVKIDLIVRGICCLVPNQPYSQNIQVTRIVDAYLEHARVWYFHHAGSVLVYLTSADWMRRNLSKRIETAFPILDPHCKQEVIDILHMQLQDNVKACYIDESLNNIFKHTLQSENVGQTGTPIRSQAAIYCYLADKYAAKGHS